MKSTKIILLKIKEFINNSNISSWKSPYISPINKIFNVDNRTYHGINKLLLALSQYNAGFKYPVWLTMKQANKINLKIKKGSKGQFVVYYNQIEIKEKDDETEEEIIKKIPLLRYYYVFNIDQIDLPDNEKNELVKKLLNINPRNNIEFSLNDFEKIIQNYYQKNNIKFLHNNFKSGYYNINRNEISIPEKQYINNDYEYYMMLAHETIHSTISKRNGIKNDYEIEEVIAEMGALFLLSNYIKLPDEIIKNAVAYIKSWTKNQTKLSKIFFVYRQVIKALEIIYDNN